jgi:hypothetical protein
LGGSYQVLIVSRRQKQFTIAISPGSYSRLKQIAEFDGKGSAALAAVWLQPKIDEEYRWRIESGLMKPKPESEGELAESPDISAELADSLAVIRELFGGGARIPAAELAIAAQVLGIDVDRLIEVAKVLGGVNANN